MIGSKIPPNVNDPFGIYRAEWLKNSIFQLFTPPAYFPELETGRPCVLIGGRGTGKTTVLKCLSYQGQYSLKRSHDHSIENWKYIGFYHRVNTNHVNAFQGKQISESVWAELFSHYLNIMMAEFIVDFIYWCKSAVSLDICFLEDECKSISMSLGIETSYSIENLKENLFNGKNDIERYLNSDAEIPILSIPGNPIDIFCSLILEKCGIKGKNIFFILDEFENLLDYQQECVNNLIKHCGEFYSFKIGVKNLGWRNKATSTHGGLLHSPADYENLDIARRLSGSSFSQFSEKVCNIRANSGILDKNFDITVQFGNFTSEKIAYFISTRGLINSVNDLYKRENIENEGIKRSSWFHLLCIYLISRSHNKTIYYILKIYENKKAEFDEEILKFYPSTLAYISKETQSPILYCGWGMYNILSAGNIRYLLELVHNARSIHLQKNEKIDDFIGHLEQTEAARWVAEKNLQEVEGVSRFGVPIRRIIIIMGSIFREVLYNSEKYGAPIDKFSINFTHNDKYTHDILYHAIMHMAFIDDSNNSSSIIFCNKNNFQIHPIFSPYLNYYPNTNRSVSIYESEFLAFSEGKNEAKVDVLDRIKDQWKNEINREIKK